MQMEHFGHKHMEESEAKEGRKRRSQKTIRGDLIEAAQAEARCKESRVISQIGDGIAHSHFSALIPALPMRNGREIVPGFSRSLQRRANSFVHPLQVTTNHENPYRFNLRQSARFGLHSPSSTHTYCGAVLIGNAVAQVQG